MPSFLPRKANPKITDMVTDVAAARKAMWAAWIDECTMAQEALIEGILFQLPSAHDRQA